MGCGWETGSRTRGIPSPYPMSTGISPSVCPGYSIILPEVQEVIDCFAHWEKGALALRIVDRKPTTKLLDGLRIYSTACAGMNRLHMTPEKER